MYLECSTLTNRLLDLLSLPLVYPLYLLAYIYHTLRFYLLPPPFPNFTLEHYRALNVNRVWNQYSRYRRVAERDPEAERLPAGAGKYLRTCEYERVDVGPIGGEVPRVGPLRVGTGRVRGVGRVGWMIRRRDVRALKVNILAPAKEGERAIFFIIGGGYVGGHPLRIHTAWSLAELTGVRVFTVNYRKSLDDASAFPASLYDCLAGWQYLIEGLGFRPENIMTNGDSAGANGCLALARYLGELEASGWTTWGQVGAMCLHCPWVDMSGSFASIRSNRFYDSIQDMSLVHIPSHTRHFPSRANLYFSPALTSAGGWEHLTRNGHGVKVYICGGTAEGMKDEIEALCRGMKADGVDVRIRMIDGMTHSDFVSFDRDEIPTRGWSWPVIREDFLHFWAYFEQDEKGSAE